MSTSAEILAMLDASPTLVYIDTESDDPVAPVPNGVYWAKVDVDEAEKVILVPRPYIVLRSSPGYDNNARFCGQVGDRVRQFLLTGVGESERQAQWVLDEARKMLSRKRLAGNLIRRSDDDQFVQREDDFTTPGGEPLFYGVDRYAVAG